jgi:CheY-like chemotaxis protein
LSVQFAAEPLWIDADRARIEQVVMNLLSNAAKYTPERGEIWLTVARDSAGKGNASDAGEAVLTVRDTGIGIAGEMLPKVFDMFAQAEQGLARSQGGLGIGLTLVRKLVEMHGGRITVESPGTGQGSTFTVRLPLARPPVAAPAAAQSLPPPKAAESSSATTSLRVLIVDDNRDAAQTLARLLKLSGHTTEVAFDGPNALQLASQGRPQLALLDIGLPVMDGYELAVRLKQAHPGLYIAAISGYGQAADRQRAKEAGFDQHFVKPVKLESLLQMLEERKTNL